MATGKPQYNAVIDLPFSRIAIYADDEGLSLLTPVTRATKLKKADNSAAEETCRQLRSYVANSKFHFSVAVKTDGTAFQRKIWRALCSIPGDQTVTYGELAQRRPDGYLWRARAKVAHLGACCG
jgi:methylated-DNA-[protein]-cysteine S-methyltransferase